jgi:hypothetical protein
MLTHPQLMARIEQYSFDNPDLGKPAFGFLDRLCVETGWDKAYAGGAIREYRRFVYLAATGDKPVTPSREVDAVWHLHLTYTRSYWERLMPLLPRALHHEPTPGGQAAAKTYRAQYADTLARYAQEFGEAAPDDFWPPEAERFQADLRFMRNGFPAQAHNGVAKPRFAAAWPLALGAGAMALGLLATGAPAFAADGLSGETVTVLVIGVGMAVLLGSLVFLSRIGGGSSKGRKRDRGDGGSVYYGGDGGSSSGGKGGKGEGGEGGEGGGDGGGCGGGCGS